MNTRIAIFAAAGLLAACSSTPTDSPTPQRAAEKPASRVEKNETKPQATSNATTVDAYKRDLALRISQVNSSKVYAGRPQALLRSVVVVKYVVDAQGNLVRSEIMRSNRDGVTESTALTSLRNTAPFPKPAPHLLKRGQLELAETWLFNTDGRFQLRTIAEPQMDR